MSRQTSDWIDSYLKFTENSEPPTTYKKWTAISLIASVLQRKCFLDWGTFNLYPNMYIVLVGPSGRCRKGTAMGVGHKFLRELGIPMAAEAITREALIRNLEKAGSEGAFSVGADGEIYDHNSLTIFSPELTVFLGYNNLQLLSDLTDWYDCRAPWKYETKNSGTNQINAVYVNLLGATTPDLVRSALPQDAVGGGLSSRMIFVSEWEKSKIVVFPFLSDEDLELHDKLKYDLEQIYTMSGGFEITKEFKRLYRPWREDSEKNPPFKDNPKFEGYVNRRANHVLKLCMILSASEDDSMVIRSSTFERAVQYLEEVEKKMPSVFFGHGSADNADITGRILQTVTALGDKGIHVNRVMRTYVGYVSGPQDLTDIFRKLEMAGYIKMDRETQMLYPVEEDE